MTVARKTAERELPAPGGGGDLQRFANAGRLAASVSHELLTALGVAQTDVGFLCDLLDHEDLRRRDLRDAAEDARAAIGRAVSRIAAVLSLARQRSGEIAGVDVKEVIGAALFDLDARLASFTVLRDLQTVPFARAERGALLQALVSLLLDAADASGPRGRIGVSLRAQGELVILAVDDEGPLSIAPDARLAICRDAVESFGGELSTGSSPLGGRRVVLQLRADRISP